MEFEYLETERLLLRKLTPEIYEYVFTHFTDEEAIEFFGLDEVALQREKMKNEKGLRSHDRTFVIFQLLLKESKEVIGATGFVRYYPDHFRAELGYAITNEEYKRKGYMFEATLPMIPYGFNKMELNRIEAFSSPQNTASIRIIEKLGFKKEGLMRQHFYRDGIAEDSTIYSILKDD